MKKILDQIEEKLSATVFVLMLAITFFNVIGRYVLHASISFTDEVTTNLFVLLSVVGTGIAARKRSHLGLSILTEMMPKRMERAVTGFGNLMGVGFGSVLFWTGCKMVENQIKNATVTPTLQWPSWVFGIFLPIGAMFIIIRFLQMAVIDIRAAAGKDAKEGGDRK